MPTLTQQISDRFNWTKQVFNTLTASIKSKIIGSQRSLPRSQFGYGLFSGRSTDYDLEIEEYPIRDRVKAKHILEILEHSSEAGLAVDIYRTDVRSSADGDDQGFTIGKFQPDGETPIDPIIKSVALELFERVYPVSLIDTMISDCVGRGDHFQSIGFVREGFSRKDTDYAIGKLLRIPPFEMFRLEENNGELIHALIHDINTSKIGERKQKRLSFGVQSSGNLFKRPEQSFKILEGALIELIKNYHLRFENMPCEFIHSFPKNIEFSSSWFVKMQSGGHLSSHIHEDGWISGAVYLAIPKKRNHPDEGAIELSTDGDEYPRMHNDFPKKTLLPEAGDVIFFPSSVFHRTIPFSSDEERICIAFDLKPAG